jgi:hypothetical protein
MNFLLRQIILFSLLLTGQFVCAQKRVEIMQPKVEFDIKGASEMLNTGNAEIHGTAYYEGKSPLGIKIGENGLQSLGRWFICIHSLHT